MAAMRIGESNEIARLKDIYDLIICIMGYMLIFYPQNNKIVYFLLEGCNLAILEWEPWQGSFSAFHRPSRPRKVDKCG